MLYISDHGGIVAITTEAAQTWSHKLRKGDLGAPGSFAYKRALRKVATDTVVLASAELLREHPERFCGDVAMLPQIQQNNDCVRENIGTPFTGGNLDLYAEQLEFGFGSDGKDELLRQMLDGMPAPRAIVVNCGPVVLVGCG